MIFNSLWESALRGELLLVDGGFCHWHLRRDGQLTIREIISTRSGAGREMLSKLKRVDGTKVIVATCPEDLESNGWYEHMGFEIWDEYISKKGRKLKVWALWNLT